MNKLLPKARTTEILEQAAGDELMIYDLRVNKAYNLNETAKIVFKACDGETSFDDLKREFGFTGDLIYFALDDLKRNDLMEADYLSPFAGMNRREVIKKVGLASMVVLPAITALLAPTAAQAATNPLGAPRGTPVSGGTLAGGENRCRFNLERQCQSGQVENFTSEPAPSGPSIVCSATCA